MKRNRSEPSLQALAPVLVTVLGLFAISIHEVLEGLVFPPVFGWFASPLSVLVSLAVVAVSAYFAVPLLLRETAEHRVAAGLPRRPQAMTGSLRPVEAVLESDGKYRTIIETMGIAALVY